MLERIPRIAAIRNRPENAAHKAMLDAAIKAQTPLIERYIRNSPVHEQLHVPSILYVLGRQLDIPLPPNRDIIGFAREIGQEWDRLTLKEIQSFGFVTGNFSSKNTGDAVFFSSRFGLGTCIRGAETMHTIVARLDLFKQFLDGQIDEATLVTKMVGLKYRIYEAKIVEGKIDYSGVRGLTGQFVNINNALEVESRKFRIKLLDIAKILSIGFNPAIC